MHTAPSQEPSRLPNWIGYAACLVAFAGLAVAILYGFNPHIRESAGSDFKTLYASSWCFVHGLDGYTFPNIAAVFRQNDVITPRSWYGHSPVYPPLTLVMLAPFTLLPMVPAINACILLGCVLMALAVCALLRETQQTFHLGLPSQLILAGLAAASPLLDIGLELANVSVLAAALCILACVPDTVRNGWVRAVCLLTALLLKPHIALWVVIAILFSAQKRDRAALVRLGILLAAAVALYVAWASLNHFGFAQFASYRQMVASELQNGSMSPGNHDVMEVFVQITSLSSLLGYWLWGSAVLSPLTACILLLTVSALARACWRRRAESESLLMRDAAAWSAFGLMATYHRDADAMILVLVVPLLLFRWKQNIYDIWSWCVAAALVAASIGPSANDLHRLVDDTPITQLPHFLWLRQASLATAALTLLLLRDVWHRSRIATRQQKTL